MDEDRKAQLKTAAEMIRELRRSYSRDFLAKVESKNEGDSLALEDEMRLVGTLEAAYNHCLASIASDGDIYCLAKHVSYAIILAGELEQPDVEPLYDILAIITNGRVEACAACAQDRRAAASKA